MKTLLLVRHAQASPMDARIQDRDRPLTTHGVEQAAKAGHAFFQGGWQVDLMLVSSAIRTQQTAAILHQALQERVKSLQVLEDFYLASESLLWAVVTKINVNVQTLMLVGHNPGLETLGRRFVASLEQLPTAGAIEVRFDCHAWSQANEHSVIDARVLW